MHHLCQWQRRGRNELPEESEGFRRLRLPLTNPLAAAVVVVVARLWRRQGGVGEGVEQRQLSPLYRAPRITLATVPSWHALGC